MSVGQFNFSLQNLIQLGGTLVVIALAYGTLDSRMSVLEARQQDDRAATEKAFTRIESALLRIENRLTQKQDRGMPR